MDNKKLPTTKNAKKRSQATREANGRPDNQDHKEDTWDEDTLEKKATEILKQI